MAKSLSPVSVALKEARDALVTQKALVAELSAKAKAEREAAKATKVEVAVAKAQARLQKLLAKQVGPVGSKAIKANRRPSKGTVVTAA